MVRALLALALCSAAVAWAQHDHGAAKPALAVSSVFDAEGRLWRTEVRERHVWVSRSEDQGHSFSTPVRVNATPENIAADGGRHLAWFDDAPARHGLFYARMEPDGRLSSPMRFGNYAAQAAHPSVLAAGARILLAWKEFDGERAIVWAMTSADGGRTWHAPHRVADTAGASDHPLLVADGGRAYLSWNTAQEGYRLLPLGEGPAP